MAGTHTHSLHCERLNCSCNSVSDSSISLESFQPQTASTPGKPHVLKRLLDYLAARGVTSKSTCDASDCSTHADPDSCSLSCSSIPETRKRTARGTRVKGTRSVAVQAGKGGQCSACSPAKTKLRPVEELQAPLTKQEEKYLTHLVRIKLKHSDDKCTVLCKTKGQPIARKRIVKPRKSSFSAASPLRKRRANQISKLRQDLSGFSAKDTTKQQGTELKQTSKVKRNQILAAAGCGEVHISSKLATKIRARLLLSWAKQRRLRRFSKSLGIKMDSEKRERQFQNKLMCGQISVHQNALYFYDKTTNAESIKDTPVVSVDDLPTFVANLLDQCEEKDRLTWSNGIPKDEVWIKIGGDHGGNSFKLVLQIANVDNPNAKESTFLVRMVECRDSVENLRKILGPVREQINRLDGMIWKEKSLRVFLFGDYDFLLKLYGISGAQSCHPCLWCKASREQIQKSPTDQPAVGDRTLSNIRSDFRKFRRNGSKPSFARVYNNVVSAPIWDIELTHVAPPYLHILLGVVKKHHDLLEQECHDLDKALAELLSKEDNPNIKHASPAFRKSVTQIKSLRRRGRLDQLKTLTVFPMLSGPITAGLDVVLKKHKIYAQAYHSRSFIGNHCHKYLTDPVIKELTDSIVLQASQLTQNANIHTAAERIRRKFASLNSLFAEVHRRVSHKEPIEDEEAKKIQHSISDYLDFFRGFFPESRTVPKQHILEAHCVPWIRRWGVGLALHGEQGGEQVHAVINGLKRRAWGMQKDEDRLRVLMQEQLTQASPLLLATSPKKKK